MIFFKRCKYWWFRRQNTYPCQAEVAELLSKTPLKTKKIIDIANHYAVLGSIAWTAVRYGVTRERVRQILMKVYRSCHVDRNARSALQIPTMQDEDI